MACFLAPAATAIITTSIKKKIPEKYHIEWLNAMLWGGVVMLIVDHIVNGEIVFYPPFLTNGFSGVLAEILRVGVPMTLVTILAWAVIVLLVSIRNKKKVRSVIT